MRLFALLLTLLLPIASIGKNLATISDTKQLCGDAVSLMQQGEVIAAFDEVRPYWSKPDTTQDQLALLTRDQLKALSVKYGDPVKYKFLDTREVGKDLVRHRFLLNYAAATYAIKFACVFIKSDAGWQLYTMSGDDQIEGAFQ